MNFYSKALFIFAFIAFQQLTVDAGTGSGSGSGSGSGTGRHKTMLTKKWEKITD